MLQCEMSVMLYIAARGSAPWLHESSDRSRSDWPLGWPPHGPWPSAQAAQQSCPGGQGQNQVGQNLLPKARIPLKSKLPKYLWALGFWQKVTKFYLREKIFQLIETIFASCKDWQVIGSYQLVIGWQSAALHLFWTPADYATCWQFFKFLLKRL